MNRRLLASGDAGRIALSYGERGESGELWVSEAKLEAMATMETQRYLQTYYAQRGEHRAKACMRVLPQVVSEL